MTINRFSRGCLAGGWNGQSTHQSGAVWGWHGLWSLPIWIDNRKNFGYKVKIIVFFFVSKNGVEYLFFESDDFAMIFSYQIPEGLAKHEPLWGRCATGRSAVLDFGGCRVPDRKTKKRQHTTIFFYFPRFGEIFWLTVNMAWSCWKGLWICIKWDILMATFHFGTQDVSYDGPWCTRPIAYSLYRSMVGSICVQVSARCALIWLSSTASGWGTYRSC